MAQANAQEKLLFEAHANKATDCFAQK